MPPFFVGTEVPQVTSRLADALKFSGMISICYGAFCFSLPHTPPKKDAVDQLAFKKAKLPKTALLESGTVEIYR